MSTTEHPARFEGIMRQARRDLAREEEASIDEALRFPSTPEGQQLLARSAVRLIKWALPIELALFVFGILALGAMLDMLGYLSTLGRGDSFMWAPALDRAAYAGILKLTLYGYPTVALLTVAGILVRGSETQKTLGTYIGCALGLVVAGGIVVFVLTA